MKTSTRSLRTKTFSNALVLVALTGALATFAPGAQAKPMFSLFGGMGPSQGQGAGLIDAAIPSNAYADRVCLFEPHYDAFGNQGGLRVCQ
jgi:hypothetical protein